MPSSSSPFPQHQAPSPFQLPQPLIIPSNNGGSFHSASTSQTSSPPLQSAISSSLSSSSSSPNINTSTVSSVPTSPLPSKFVPEQVLFLGKDELTKEEFYAITYKNNRMWYIGNAIQTEIGGFLRHGRGTLRYADGSVYEGEFCKDHFHGQGTFKFADNSVYRGQFAMGKFDGKGEMQYSNGDKYQGEWQNGKIHGYGCLYNLITASSHHHHHQQQQQASHKHFGHTSTSNYEVYEGDFRNGKKEGYGVYKYASGAIYNGSWKNNCKEGGGIYYHSNGDRFEGTWAKDKKHGRGLMLTKAGQALSQIFDNGKLLTQTSKSATCRVLILCSPESVEEGITDEVIKKASMDLGTLSQPTSASNPFLRSGQNLIGTAFDLACLRRVFSQPELAKNLQIENALFNHTASRKAEYIEHIKKLFEAKLSFNSTSSNTIEGSSGSLSPEDHHTFYDSYWIWYTGHGNKKGEWCFSDGFFSFQELVTLWRQSSAYKSGKSHLIITSDACHSGCWVQELQQMKDTSIIIQASCLAFQKAFDTDSGAIFMRQWLELLCNQRHTSAYQVPQVPLLYHYTKEGVENTMCYEIMPSLYLFGSPYFDRNQMDKRIELL